MQTALTFSKNRNVFQSSKHNTYPSRCSLISAGCNGGNSITVSQKSQWQESRLLVVFESVYRAQNATPRFQKNRTIHSQWWGKLSICSGLTVDNSVILLLGSFAWASRTSSAVSIFFGWLMYVSVAHSSASVDQSTFEWYLKFWLKQKETPYKCIAMIIARCELC